MAGLRELPQSPESNAPRTRVLDRPTLGITNGGMIVGQSRGSTVFNLVGFRHYRLKWRITSNIGGAPVVTVRLSDMAFDRLQAWETVIIFAIPFGVNGANVINFGEGTGILEGFTGPFFQVVWTNGGPGAIVLQEAELWAGS